LNKRLFNNPHEVNKGNIVKSQNIIEIQNFEHPIFCFKYIHNNYSLEQCNDSQKVSFIDKIIMLSSITWDLINKNNKHKLGYEKMPISELIPSCPAFITPDVKHLLVFRYHGLKPFLGHRNRFIFHIIFIEREFGEVYEH
jgi:hypothetical protein